MLVVVLVFLIDEIHSSKANSVVVLVDVVFRADFRYLQGRNSDVDGGNTWAEGPQF